MRKRLTAWMMAAILAVTPVNGVMAEEFLTGDESYTMAESDISGEIDLPDLSADDEIIAEGSGSLYEMGAEQEESPEELSESVQYQEEEMTPEGGLIVSAIEEVDTKNYVSLDESGEPAAEMSETLEVTETVSESGWARDAEQAVSRVFRASQYQGSYGAQLSDQAKEIYDAMKKAYVTNHSTGNVAITFTTPITFETDYVVSYVTDSATGETKLSLTSFDKNENYNSSMIYAAQAAYDAFVYDHPEVFWISAMSYQISVIYTATEGEHTGVLKIPGITLKTAESYTGAFQEITAFDTSVAAVTASIRQGLTENAAAVEIAEAIMDYLCDNLSYQYQEGTTSDEIKWAHSAAGVFLKDKNVVCEGYAKAYKILCGQFGITCALIPGQVGAAQAAHMWNAVYVAGQWYLVDVTWADTANNREKYFLSGSSELADENRIMSTNFSGSSYTQVFVLPEISETSYTGQSQDDSHTHIFWEYTSNNDATCMSDGTMTASCIYGCGAKDTVTDAGTKLDHNFTDYVSNNDATCMSDGTKTALCNYGCGTKDTVTASGTKLSHKFTNYVSNNDASWYQDGTKTAVCAYGCGTKNTVTDVGSAKIPTISLNATSIALKKGQSTTAVKVSGLASGDKVVSWKSANTSLVKVNSKTGKITAQKKTGTTKVTVTLQSGLTKSITVKVQSSTVRTTKITVASNRLTVQKGKKTTLAPALTPVTSQEKITYSSSNKKVAAVNSKGVITAKAVGTARITVKSGSRKVTVTVTVPKITATKITGISQAVTLKAGKTKILKPKLYPTGSTDTVKYSTSNKAVATVSSKGKITAKKKGTAVITVKAGKAAVKCKVTVK